MTASGYGGECAGGSEVLFEFDTGSALNTATNFMDAIHSVAALNVSASVAGNSASARISLTNNGTGSDGNVLISSVTASAGLSYYTSGGMAGGTNAYTLTEHSASLAPNLPSYFYGKSSVTILATSSFAGAPSLSEILAAAEFIYDRDMESTSYSSASLGWRLGQQVSESFNLSDLVLTDVPNGVGAQRRWLIQSKFETPLLNFANVSVDSPLKASTPMAAGCDMIITSKGIGHQYGSLPARNEGIFVEITTPPVVESPSLGTIRAPKSLAEVVGFEEGVVKKIGKIQKEQRLEEAVVIIPYIEENNRRKFLKFPWTGRAALPSYQNLVAAMDKYVFPPKFDFTRFATIKPVLMYVFEFGMDITQQDLADIWQSLPPGRAMSECELCGCTNAEFDMKEVVVEDNRLVKKIIAKDKDLYWMVFKVKRRATSGYETMRRQLVQPEYEGPAGPGLAVARGGQYTYNWPYDYFSIVELVKIDETIRYLTGGEPAGDPTTDCVKLVPCDPCDEPTPTTPTSAPDPEHHRAGQNAGTGERTSSRSGCSKT